MSEHVLSLHGLQNSRGFTRADAKEEDQRKSAKPVSGARWIRPQGWDYRLIYGVTFMFFLFAAAIEMFDPRRYLNRGAPGEAREHQTIVQKASLGARTCAAYAFMG